MYRLLSLTSVHTAVLCHYRSTFVMRCSTLVLISIFPLQISLFVCSFFFYGLISQNSNLLVFRRTMKFSHAYSLLTFVIDAIVIVLCQATEVILTVYDKPTLRQLNVAVPVSCGQTSWQYGISQVVTNTSGCPVIGVDVAHFETDVVRVDRRHHWPLLYLGQTHAMCYTNAGYFPFLFNRLRFLKLLCQAFQCLAA